ncbi:hypothetical protein COI_1383 [Mannheimia haemolytica serotype A2 str. OVINE]|nr:hypothetical protein COI_1383 [Mannheimia haemolytica serotype A2 str. OVINE]
MSSDVKITVNTMAKNSNKTACSTRSQAVIFPPKFAKGYLNQIIVKSRLHPRLFSFKVVILFINYED